MAKIKRKKIGITRLLESEYVKRIEKAWCVDREHGFEEKGVDVYLQFPTMAYKIEDEYFDEDHKEYVVKISKHPGPVIQIVPPEIKINIPYETKALVLIEKEKCIDKCTDCTCD